MISTRRNLLASAGVAAIAVGVSGCGQSVDIVSTVSQLIQKIQAGVASACAAFGKWVPTVETVLTVIGGLVGAAITDANVTAAVAFIQQAITTIAAQCPQQPAPAPTPAPQLKATVGGKDVPIVFY